MIWSYVVTGGGRGVGRAIVERLLRDGASVAVLKLDPAALDWIAAHPASSRLAGVVGSAAEVATAEHAADQAQEMGSLVGWVNNAAAFEDASLHTDPPRQVKGLIDRNLAPVVVGCATAVRRFRAVASSGRADVPAGGSVVNVSSQQARGPCAVRCPMPRRRPRSKA